MSFQKKNQLRELGCKTDIDAIFNHKKSINLNTTFTGFKSINSESND